MKYSYYLLGLLLGYYLIDFSPSYDMGITKKTFFDMANWDNSTIEGIIINKDKDIANIGMDFYDYNWYDLSNNSMVCQYNTSASDVENFCTNVKSKQNKIKIYNILLPSNHNFEEELLQNEKTKDIDVLYINNPKPNFILEMFNKVFYYLIIFIIFKTILSYLTGAFVAGVQQATDSGSPFRIIKPEKNKEKPQLLTKLKDIAGYQDTKAEVSEYIEYLKTREKYVKMGAKLPRGLLLIGKPGSGKTLLAKAIAGESQVSFIHCSGSDFNDRFIGMGSNRVGQLFKLARENSPSIIFIDEIDSIGASRDNYSQGISHEHNVTLNKLLVEMDGFSDNDNILVIASTNRHKSLDSALTRSGRFDRKIVIDLPNVKERQEIFSLYLSKIPLIKDLESNDNIEKFSLKLAKKTSGVSGADISNICNQSAILAVREDKDNVEWIHLEKAIDDIMIGIEKRSRMMSDQEKNIVAHHEAGHALMGYLLKDCSPPIKVSIIPRGVDALGFSQQEPEEKKLYNKEELLSRIAVLFGGRAAEDIMFNQITTGASDDIERATELLYSMITTYGLNQNIGLLNYQKSRHTNIGTNKQNKIEEEMTNISNKIYKWTQTILEKNKSLVEKLAESLLQNEILLGEEIAELIDSESKLINSLKVLEE